MENTRQATTPEELHSDLRETREEVAAVARAEDAEITEEIATEATVRAGGHTEEAESWTEMSASEEAIQELMTRGVVDIIVRDEFEKKLRSGRKLRVKLGIDPTGPLLHIGRSVPLFKLRQFQELGHQVVLIIGDFTAIVGDASDKDAQRLMLTRDQIERNMETYREQIGHILDIDKVEFSYNSQWLAPLTFNDVIRLASKFTVAQMIQRENFSDRWDAGKPIGLHELLYPLMQGFDSVAIEADVELGGTDQLFNLMAGRALQEDFGQSPQTVMTVNMIEGTDGRKMSTSWGNAIFLLDEPRDQFGKIMSMSDHVLPTYLESVTRIPMVEVKAMVQQLEDESVNPIEIKKRLAWEIVKMYHGEAAADQARDDFERQFQRGELPSQMPVVPVDKALSQKANDDGTIGLLDLLINIGLAPSRKHAQRLVEQGAVRINDVAFTDRETIVKPAEGMIIKAGRSYVRIEG